VVVASEFEPPELDVRGAVLADLAAEGDELDGLVCVLDSSMWATPTPAPGWSIAHQIAHLASTDVAALASTTYVSGTAAVLRGLTDTNQLLASARVAAAAGRWLLRRGIRRWSTEELPGLIDALAESESRTTPARLLARWRTGRTRLGTALATVPASATLPWFGHPLRPTAMATARLMETWAHGQDIADGLGIVREPTQRLRHIARLGVRTRDFAYRLHRRTPPAAEFRVELTAPDGALWRWGPEGAAGRVTGPALDFCLLVTQRRHLDDLDLTAHGEAAEWLPLAQAFVGPPGPGRAPVHKHRASKNQQPENRDC
jgi:uncharacterized protein (TIGR03084 family)